MNAIIIIQNKIENNKTVFAKLKISHIRRIFLISSRKKDYHHPVGSVMISILHEMVRSDIVPSTFVRKKT